MRPFQQEDQVCRIKTLRKEVMKKYKIFKTNKGYNLDMSNKIFA